MGLIFQILCGILYVIGLLFGWTYQEVSIEICLKWWPWICFFSTLPIIIGLIKRIITNKKRWFAVYLLPFAISYSTIYYLVIKLINYRYFKISVDPFNDCMNDLIHIASKCDMTYAEVNLHIYVTFFLILIITNYVLTKLAFKQYSINADSNVRIFCL